MTAIHWPKVHFLDWNSGWWFENSDHIVSFVMFMCVCIGCRCYLLWARAHTHTSTNVIVYEKQLVDEYWCVLAGCIPSEFATWAVTKRRRRKKKRLYVKKIDSCVGWTETTKTSVAEFRVKRFHHSDALKRRCNLSCSYAAMRHNSTHSNTTLSVHTGGFFLLLFFMHYYTLVQHHPIYRRQFFFMPYVKTVFRFLTENDRALRQLVFCA